MATAGRLRDGFQNEQQISGFDHLGILGDNAPDHAGRARPQGREQLHDLEQADVRIGFNALTDVDVRRRARLGGPIKSAQVWRADLQPTNWDDGLGGRTLRCGLCHRS